jgi:hypothetical protein
LLPLLLLLCCAGAEADQWERGKPLPPMPGGMQQYDGRRGGPPPGMRMMPGGPMQQLHKTDSAYKVPTLLYFSLSLASGQRLCFAEGLQQCYFDFNSASSSLTF